MEQIKDKTFKSETVRLDGKLFCNCAFEDCLLMFGGEPCEWQDTRFANCKVVLDGAAHNTVSVLRGLGFDVIPPK